MRFTKHQIVIVRKKPATRRGKTVALQDWIAQHQFTGIVMAVNDNLIKVSRLDSETLYGNGEDSESITINTESDQYDIQLLKTEPSFQLEPMAIAML